MIRNLVFLVFFAFTSCSYFQEAQKPESIARVGDSYLYKTDLKGIIPVGTSKEDSLLLVRNYIDRWAAQKLLIAAAERNLGDDKKKEFDLLIKQYKIDLYTKAYLEEVIKRTVDTLVGDKELQQYYDENKENFKTNGTLVRLRYIHLAKDNPRFGTIQSKFFDFKKSDKKFWDTYVLQFKDFALNDTVWVDMNQVYQKLPFITPDNRDQYIVAGRKIELQENANVYLVKVTNTIDRNQMSPFEYIKPTLKEVILNKRKLELIKKFEKEITDDAIKNNDYEIYK
jgi:hypothetical protein